MDRDDARQIVRTVYGEYLTETFGKDWRDARNVARYLNDFDQGEPRWADASALRKSTEACMSSPGPQEGYIAAHSAFWEEKLRQEFNQKNAHPSQRRSEDWHQREAEYVTEGIRRHNQSKTLNQTHETAAAELMPEQELIDHVRHHGREADTGQEPSQSSLDVHPDDVALAAQIHNSHANPEMEGSSEQTLIDHVKGSKRLVEPPKRSNRNDFTRYQGLHR